MSENQNTSIVEQEKPIYGRCEQCEFMQSCKLSQQIVQLREKILFYQNKNKQLQTFVQKGYQQQSKVLQQYNIALQRSLGNDIENEIDLQSLQKQLLLMDKQIQQEKILQQAQKLQYNELIQQLINLQNCQFNSQKEYQQLLKQQDDLTRKQHKLNSLKSLFQRTNFISIIYSISFQDGDSFLNGEKITSQNSWKVIQILAFYQKKYSQYEPVARIDWDLMKIFPKQQNIQKSNIDIITSDPIQICCDTIVNIQQTWMRYIVLEMKNIFQFLVKQSGLNSKLKYQVTNQGEFQCVKCKIFQNQNQQFKFTMKCLLTGIDQINQLEFFAKEKRIKQGNKQQQS